MTTGSFLFQFTFSWGKIFIEECVTSFRKPKSGLDKRAEDSRLNSFKTEIKKWILGTDESPPGVPFDFSAFLCKFYIYGGF